MEQSKQDKFFYHKKKYKGKEDYVETVKELVDLPLIDSSIKGHSNDFLSEFNMSVAFFVGDYFYKKDINTVDIKYKFFVSDKPIPNSGNKYLYNTVWIFTKTEIYAFGINPKLPEELNYAEYKTIDINQVELNYCYKKSDDLKGLTTENDFIYDKPNVNSITIIFNDESKIEFVKSKENEDVFEEFADFLIKFDK